MMNGNSSPIPSPTLSANSMPPMPPCLKSLLQGDEHWKEVEKVQTLKALIQPSFDDTYTPASRAAHYLPMDKYKLRRDRSSSPATPNKAKDFVFAKPWEVVTNSKPGYTVSNSKPKNTTVNGKPRDTASGSKPRDEVTNSKSREMVLKSREAIQKSREAFFSKKAAETKQEWTGSLGAAIAHLKDEMAALRKLDVSLLCQLCTLNESIQEYKQMVQDRLDATSETSSLYSMDLGMESISTIEEEDSDTVSYCSRTGSCSDEPLYLEPRSEPYYANITNTKQRWLPNEPIYENVFRETSC